MQLLHSAAVAARTARANRLDEVPQSAPASRFVPVACTVLRGSTMPGSPRPSVMFCLGAVLVLAACSMGDEPQRLHTTKPAPAASGSIAILPRQPMLPTYPCSRCHTGRPPNETQRVLTEFHTQKVLAHGTEGGWCYRCHTKDNIDQLHLPDDKLVSFNEAYELCGGCHGDKLRDWKANLHGLTTGYWLGDRQRRSCPACHDPHQPRFPQMTPEHAPALPRTVTDSPHTAKPAQGEHDDKEH